MLDQGALATIKLGNWYTRGEGMIGELIKLRRVRSLEAP